MENLKLLLKVFSLVTLISFQVAAAENVFKSMSLAGELGGSLSLIFSDKETNANGFGMGTHWGLYSSTNRKNGKLNFKLRLDNISLREEPLGSASSTYLAGGSLLKSLEQDWMILAVGPEFRSEKKNYVFFWEALLGYAVGQASRVFLKYDTPDLGVSKLEVDTNSSLVVSAGFGFKKTYKNRFSIFASLRTYLLFSTIYSETDLKDKSMFPFPLMFSFGTEYQL